MYAASGESISCVQWLIQVAQPDINIHIKNKDGKTALLWALEYKNSEIAKWLIKEAKPNVNDTDNVRELINV